MTVSTILAGKGREVVSVEPSTSLADAVRLLASKRIGAALVLGADRRISGIISERDIVRRLPERGAAMLDGPVADIMVKEVRCAAPDDEVESLMAVMTTHRIRHLPVVREGELVGIVSIGDVVKHRVDALEDDNRALVDYIHAR